jgi:hypothetical protein
MANGWTAGSDPFFQWEDGGFSVGGVGVDIGWGEDEEQVEYFPPPEQQSTTWGTSDIGGYLLLGLGIAAVYMLVK